ncbi:MAG: NAD(P)-dependent alcohol dehydrogenase [Desulfobacteraceae bacterium]|nr:NAD(P)-dependent alcohol dehydrogenase [Desulfobacteraceae bacterium]
MLHTRAAVVHRPGGPFVIEEVRLDDPRPGEVLVKMAGCGVCHTDIAARDGLFGSEFPAVFGHEGAGVVELVGAGVERVRPGDTVVLSFSSCGKCPQCKRGHPAHCTAFSSLNFGGSSRYSSPAMWDASGEPVAASFFGQSSFAGLALARERSVVVVDSQRGDDPAMLAPLGCGLQAGAGTVLNELKPEPGQTLAVFGAGTVGMGAVMAARLAGVDRIVAVDIVPARLETARQLGAWLTIDARADDISEQIRESAGLVDLMVETTGRSRILGQALKCLTPEGKLSMLAVSVDEASEYDFPVQEGQTVFDSIAGDSDPQEFIPYMIRQYGAGKFPFDTLVREYPFSEINRAVEDSLSGFAIKPLLRF